ncbi:MAG: hypothetical protein ACUVSU_04430 [Aggregatilineaceae bacterium]
MRLPAQRTPLLWPLLLMAVAIVLLLDNFMLVELDLAPYWPVLLVVGGLIVLVRGDIAPSWGAHTFGITRGSVETGAIEIESGEIDVQLQALRKPGRLVAGQYTARSRPSLLVRNNRARLTMQRGQTWWLSLADWDIGLAQDLPWQILMSSYLGLLEADLRGLIVERAYVASGLGDVTVFCPDRCSGDLVARSAFGDVRVTVPPRSQALVRVQAGPFARVRIDQKRFVALEPGLYASRLYATQAAEGTANQADLTITVSTTFGTITCS